MTYESSGSLRCSWPSCLKASDPTRRAACSANEPNSVGHFVPYGCISMFNEDIEDLYRRVGAGARFCGKNHSNQITPVAPRNAHKPGISANIATCNKHPLGGPDL